MYAKVEKLSVLSTSNSKIAQLVVPLVFLQIIAQLVFKDIFSPTLFVFYRVLKRKHLR